MRSAEYTAWSPATRGPPPARRHASRAVRSAIQGGAWGRREPTRCPDGTTAHTERPRAKAEAFEELLTSVRQLGAIRRGERKPLRSTTFEPTDVKAVRADLGQSQAEFAMMIGVSVAHETRDKAAHHASRDFPTAVRSALHPIGSPRPL